MRTQIEQLLVRKGPALLALPVRLTPGSVSGPLAAQCLSQILKPHLAAGQLNFLENRTVSIDISDLPFQLSLSLQSGRLHHSQQVADVTICGSLNDFWRLLSEDVDPDTLFFHRRLVIEGDTELGLSLKNCLDSLEFTGLAARLRRAAGWPGMLVEKHQPLI